MNPLQLSFDQLCNVRCCCCCFCIIPMDIVLLLLLCARRLYYTYTHTLGLLLVCDDCTP